MNKKQIWKDYENKDYLDEKGKVRTKVVYKGRFYAAANPENVALLKRILLLLLPLVIALYIAVLAVNNEATRQAYFVLPFAAQCFPLFIIVRAAYKLCAVKPPYKRGDKTAIFDTSRQGAIAGIVLSSACIVGLIIKMILCGAETLDVLPGISLIVTLPSYAYVLGSFAKIKMEEQSSEAVTMPQKPLEISDNIEQASDKKEDNEVI